MDDLRRMAVFACVVECSAFGRAALRLGLTTSAVSQHVRALELSLGVTLLHRSTRKLSLTEAGRAYYEECANVVHAAERGRQKVAALSDEPAGELRIAVPSQLAHQYLVPALHDFIHAYPQLSLRIDVNDEHVDLIDERIDLAVRVGDLQDSALVARRVAWFDELLCASPAYLATVSAALSPEQLDAMECLIFTPLGEPAFTDLVHADGQTRRVRLRGRVATNQAQTLRALALGGHGVARLLYVDVHEDIAAGRLQVLLPDWRLAGLGVYAITPRRDAQPLKVSRCIEHIQAYFSTLGNVARP